MAEYDIYWGGPPLRQTGRLGLFPQGPITQECDYEIAGERENCSYGNSRFIDLRPASNSHYNSEWKNQDALRDYLINRSPPPAVGDAWNVVVIPAQALLHGIAWNVVQPVTGMNADIVGKYNGVVYGTIDLSVADSGFILAPPANLWYPQNEIVQVVFTAVSTITSSCGPVVPDPVDCCSPCAPGSSGLAPVEAWDNLAFWVSAVIDKPFTGK